MKKIKNLIFVGLLIFLFVEILIVFPSKLEIDEDKVYKDRKARGEPIYREKKSDGEEDEEIDTGSKLSSQRMGGVHLVESQQGLRDWELFAESAEGSQTSGTWQLHQVRVLFYHKDKVEFTVNGDHGTIDAKSKDLSIKGHVTTKSENGYQFQTSSIFYSASKRQIQSPSEVSMKAPKDSSGEGLFVKGRNMLVAVDESQMIIRDQVIANKMLKKGKNLEISADAAEFSGKNHEAKFAGKVLISYDNMKLEGPEAAFTYGEGTDVLSAVNLNGGVRVTGVDKSAVSQTLNLDLLSNKYTFRGNPKVTQNDDELSGEEIIFLDGGKKVRIEKARAKVENNKP